MTDSKGLTRLEQIAWDLAEGDSPEGEWLTNNGDCVFCWVYRGKGRHQKPHKPACPYRRAVEYMAGLEAAELC